MATAKPLWQRAVESFARGSAKVGLLLATGLGILGLVAIQVADIFQLLLSPDRREGWLVVAVIAILVSSVSALWVRHRQASKEKDAVHRGART